MDKQTETEVVLGRKYAELLSIPSISKAHFREEDRGVITVYSEWSFVDVPSKTTKTFAKTFTLLKGEVIHESPAILLDAKLTCAYQPGLAGTDLGILAVVNARPPSNNDKTEGEILQIFKKNVPHKTFDLKYLDIHNQIYTNGFWGSTMAWSPDGKKLMYLAEKKTTRQSPFFSTYGIDPNANIDELGEIRAKAKIGMGEEFAFKQSWGEQLETFFQSVIVVLDIDSEEFKVVSLPDEIFPCDLQWVGNTSIIATGYINSKWRLGLIYCTNRESRIFQVDCTGENFKYLSDTGVAAFSPRVRPDGKFVAWEQRTVGGPHDSARSIMGLHLNENEEHYEIYPTNPKNKIPVFANISQHCWTLDGSKLLVITPNETEYVLLVFCFTSEKVILEPQVTRDVHRILGITENYLLISKSSALDSHMLQILVLKTLEQHFSVCTGVRAISDEIKRITIEGFSPASFYYGPGNAADKSVPLIVLPHGGPHSVLLDEFNADITLFLQLGFGVLRLNYIGSTGGASDPADLCGKIGSLDVNHCQTLVQELLEQETSVNPDKVVLYGGSHGGFLGAHLSSSFPEFYKAAVLRNPVTDLTSIVNTSDITDWGIVEAGVPHEVATYLPFVRTVSDAEKLIELSPIRHAGKVKAGTLLLLGSEDLRVPMSQGFAYYRALKHFNKQTEVRVYNDCHSLQKKVPTRLDGMIQSILWFKKFIKHPC